MKSKIILTIMFATFLVLSLSVASAYHYNPYYSTTNSHITTSSSTKTVSYSKTTTTTYSGANHQNYPSRIQYNVYRPSYNGPTYYLVNTQNFGYDQNHNYVNSYSSRTSYTKTSSTKTFNSYNYNRNLHYQPWYSWY